MNNKPLKEMTRKELREYLSQYRNDEGKFSAGLGELLSRPRPNAIHFPASMPREEQKRRFLKLFEETNKDSHK